jgi:hypothetical protein
MRGLDYYTKRDLAFEQHDKVAKIKSVAPKGAKTYIKQRQADLKFIKKQISQER